LRIVPPQDASDRRPKTYTFIEAVQKLSTTLVDAELSEVASKVPVQFTGRLRELFVIISDDMVSRRPTSSTRASKRGPDAPADGEPSSQRIIDSVD